MAGVSWVRPNYCIDLYFLPLQASRCKDRWYESTRLDTQNVILIIIDLNRSLIVIFIVTIILFNDLL